MINCWLNFSYHYRETRKWRECHFLLWTVKNEPHSLQTRKCSEYLWRKLLIFILGCGTGYYSTYPDPNSCECEICTTGTYNDRDFATSCTSCPGELTTVQEGSTSISQCGMIIHIKLFTIWFFLESVYFWFHIFLWKPQIPSLFYSKM